LRVPSNGRKIASTSGFGNPIPPLGEDKEALVAAVLTVIVTVVVPLPAGMVDGVIVYVAPAGSPVNVNATALTNVELPWGANCTV
jgi:hypothetical protein